MSCPALNARSSNHNNILNLMLKFDLTEKLSCGWCYKVHLFFTPNEICSNKTLFWSDEIKMRLNGISMNIDSELQQFIKITVLLLFWRAFD